MSQGTSKSDILQHFVKHAEQSNVRRAEIFKRGKNKGTLVALAAAAFAVGSYLFSVNAVRQGRFLDESFDKTPDSIVDKK